MARVISSNFNLNANIFFYCLKEHPQPLAKNIKHLIMTKKLAIITKAISENCRKTNTEIVNLYNQLFYNKLKKEKLNIYPKIF